MKRAKRSRIRAVSRDRQASGGLWFSGFDRLDDRLLNGMRNLVLREHFQDRLGKASGVYLEAQSPKVARKEADRSQEIELRPDGVHPAPDRAESRCVVSARFRQKR